MPRQKPVRIGIAGLGPRGRLSWMKNLLRIKTCRVTALCDRVDALVGQAYREAGDPDIACFTDFDEMLAKADVDAVAIVTAPHDQPDLICRAMEAGKHAACEVSLTYNMDDLWRVVVAVERSGLKFQMAEQVMYHPFVKAWRRLVQEGELGHVIFAEGQYLHGMTPDRFWLDSETGERIHLDDASNHPRAVKSRLWNWFPHPILYMATDLGPILTVLQDRVTKVTCMATRPQSYHYKGIPASDIEVALMHTENDTIIRMAVGFTYATPRDHHWWHLEGTAGKVETARSAEIYGRSPGVDTPKIWLESSGEESMQATAWKYAPEDLPEEARESGHGNMDYFALSSFLDTILDDTDPLLNVYRSAELTAPAIVAVQSVDQGSACLEVPDFRPSEKRKAGAFPD
ncbi:MAG: Gfo/Idh/MocA family oxidoreductase [Candidatus Latescibacteria bacterium]|nr:Gfo/Idh/MocA family oxidoreductase [Candidatus Latescibacterota bacterium]